jgi:O-antigen ligase
MLYFCLLLYVTAIYVRPSEILPSLGEVPVVDILAGITTIIGAVALLLRPRRFVVTPTDLCVVGFWAAIITSNLAWGWFGGAWYGLLDFLPVVFCYFLVRVAVQTPQQSRGLVHLFVFLNLILAVSGIIQYHTGAGLGGVEAITDEHRIRGTGIFNDPNDLGMTLVMAVAFVLVDVCNPGATIRRRLTSLLVLIPLLVAIYYANSRGTVAGLGIVFVAFSYRRFRRISGPLIAATALLMISLFGPSRTSAMDVSESSAQSRIEAWGQGLRMLKAEPIFGVGYGRFTEFHHKVAHNSFVHASAELGLFGACFLVGCFYAFFRGIGKLTRADSSVSDEPQCAEALGLSALGAITCSLFLSRQYVVVPYLLLAMGVTHATMLVDREQFWSNAIVHSVAVVIVTAISVVTIWVVVRAFGAW